MAMGDALVELPDASATRVLGERLASCLYPGLTIFLRGDLGAGKTTLARACLRALGYTGPVKSPTYTLVESYELPELKLHHLDLYRLADPEELEWIGIRDLADGQGILLVEWPERGVGGLPPPDLELALAHAGEARSARLGAGTAAGKRLLACVLPAPA